MLIATETLTYVALALVTALLISFLSSPVVKSFA